MTAIYIGSASKRDPQAIYVYGREVSRGPVSVFLASHLRRLFLILAARQNCVVSTNEIIDALWGDDAEGGPENAARTVTVMLSDLRDAGAALGFRVDTTWGRGWTLTTVPR